MYICTYVCIYAYMHICKHGSASPAAPSPAAALPLVAVPEVWGTPGTSPARPAAPVEVGLAAVLALGARGAGWGAGLVAGIVVVEGLRPPLMPQ